MTQRNLHRAKVNRHGASNWRNFVPDKLVDFPVQLVHETEKAYLVDDGTVQAWLPKSLTELEKNADGTYTCTIPRRTFEEKGFA